MKEVKRWSVLFGVLFFLWLVYLLSSVMTPFIMGAFLAYLTDPLVTQLERIKIPRILGVILVFLFLALLLLLLLFIIVPILEQQLMQWVNSLPTAFNWIQKNILPRLQEEFGVSTTFDANWIKQNLTAHWQQAGGVAAAVVKTLSRSGMTLFSWGLNLVLTPVVMFYLLRDWNHLEQGIGKLIPRRIEPTVVHLFRECDSVLSAFIRGQLMVMFGLGFLYFIGMSLVGLHLALLIGMLGGLVSIVPYLGFILGITLATIASFIQFHDWIHVLFIWLVFIVSQGLEATCLTPWLVGDKIGLHPVAVIFAVLAGGELFGFIGVLLALPASAVIMVFIRYLKEKYVNSGLYMKSSQR